MGLIFDGLSLVINNLWIFVPQCCTQSAITVTALSTGQILGQVEPHCVCGGIGFFVVDPNGNRVAVVRPPTSWGCSSRTDVRWLVILLIK